MRQYDIRKNLKQTISSIFPWLPALKRRLRVLYFYTKLRLDGNDYAAYQSADTLPNHLFSGSEALYNDKTGFDMQYQENKVFNLKLVTRVLDGVVIRPGETFSFWHLARHADRTERYKDGLVNVGGELTTAPGGGLCQMSNSLFWAFLHSPLSVVERHGHTVKEFPEPNSDSIKGVDATIAEGAKDLKVKNETPYSFQISISFDSENITVGLFTDASGMPEYRVENTDPVYYMEGDATFESVAVCRTAYGQYGRCVENRRLLYINRCRIGYPLPDGTSILKEGTPWQHKATG